MQNPLLDIVQRHMGNHLWHAILRLSRTVGGGVVKFQYNDGGRKRAGYKGNAGDCVTRSIAIATGKPYQEVYEEINTLAKSERRGNRKRGRSSARNGVHKPTIRKYLASLGWLWTPTMFIGSGCRVHLTDGELPKGRLIVSVSKHLTAVIDGTIHDTHDPQRSTIIIENGVKRVAGRCVYGYWQGAK